MKEGGRGGDGEADGDERGEKMGKASKTPSEVSVYKHVRREEKGMEHLEHCSSEEVCQISCFLLFAFT